MNDLQFSQDFVQKGYFERSASRFGCIIQAEVIVTNGEKIFCSMVDLSQTGCRLESFADIEDLRNFRIKFSGLEAQWADVIWKKEYLYGVQFRKPLASYVVEHILKTLPQTNEAA